jgi:hypothetical protein
MPKNRRLTAKQLAAEPDVQLRDNIRPLLSGFWKQLQAGVDRGDMKALKMAAEIVNYTKGPGGITIFNQQMVAGGGRVEGQRARSFDQIIDQLEEKDRVRGLLANSNEVADLEEDITDAETEDIPAAELQDA